VQRVVLADDDVLLREGLASLLGRSGYDVVGQAGNAVDLVELVREHRPGLVIIDIRMPPSNTTDGLDAAGVIRQEFPDIAILVLSAHVEVEHAVALLASGRGVGYLLKGRVIDVAEFIDTLARIARGGSVVDPSLVQELVAARRLGDPLGALTERERQVLALMAEGRSNAGIGRRLWVSESTVEKHVGSILTKLGLFDTDDEHHRRVLAVVRFLEAR
jgi:DNA-binding NarL/FixJ family response regulator